MNQEIMRMCRPEISRFGVNVVHPDGEQMCKSITMHETIIKSGCAAIVHSSFSAPDHPQAMRFKRELEEVHGESLASIQEIQGCISHSVGNTEKGIPEWIVVNAEPAYAEKLIEKFNAAWNCCKHSILARPVENDEDIVVSHEIHDENALRHYENEAATFAGMQLRLNDLGLKPRWIQLVYSDNRYRMPWDPGVDPEGYQPIIGMKVKTYLKGGEMVQ